MILRVPSFVLTAWLAAALACAPAAFAAEEADSIGGAFGDEAQATADPFPPEALQVATSGDCPALLDHRVPDIRGRTINLCAFSGKVLLVVNTASRWGFAPQFKGLESLYETYGKDGLVVMGFPSGDFNQELADNADIAEFCRTQYGVRFPMFAKTHVRGEGKIPLFRELVAQAGAGREIAWNYEKFLIDRRGKVAGRFATRTPPRSDEVVAAIEKALAGK